MKQPGGDSSSLIKLLDRWRSTTIVVAGDFMLDHYIYGNADRLSPDAPVPVLSIRQENFSPGGASNVCLDLAALHCKVRCLGVVGEDQPGQTLCDALEDAGCQTRGLVRASTRPTSLKQNYVGLAQHRHPQKMFRVDREDRSPLDEKLSKRLLAAAERALDGADMLCLEDYNKGVLSEPACTALIEMADRMNIPVLVDPAATDDYTKYRGATCITPNRTEAQRATGLNGDDEPAMARKLMRSLKLSVVVLTLDRHGALLLEKGRRARRMPTLARSVYDVTGAGDMVLAMLAAARANGADWPAATELANIAAGLEVERFGCVPIELGEVLLALLQQRHEQLGKLRDIDQLLPELAAHRRQGKRIAFTNGCFDILHAGHVSYLREARKLGDLLIVALNADDSIRRIKGEGRPVNRETDRILVMSELSSVDYVILFHEDTPIPLLKRIKPDVLVKGADYKQDSDVVGHEVVREYGGEIRRVSLVPGYSTTNLIGRIRATQ